MKFWLLLLSTLFLTGCTSLFFNDYKQVVLVQSDPSGAEIFNQTGEKLGVTPAYVKVRRDTRAQLTLKSNEGEIKSITLKGRYRWSPSFFGNLVYVTLAPVGWGIDYLTKTAFQFEYFPAVTFDKNSVGPEPIRPPVTVIAPPQSEYLSLSRDAAMIVEQELGKRFPGFQTRGYEKTRPVFNRYHWRNDTKPDEEYLEKILYTLQADQFVETSLSETDHSLKFDVTIRDAFTRNPVASFYFEKPLEDFRTYRKTPTLRYLSKYFTFAPNATGIDFSSYSSTFVLTPGHALPDGVTIISGDRVKERGFNQVLSWVGALNLLYIRPPRTDPGWRWKLLFVPDLYLSAVTFTYPDLKDIKDVEFQRVRAGGGYGPQLSTSSPYGTIYLSFLPTYNYTRITWDNGANSGRSEVGEILISYELGYQIYLSDALVFRMFIKGWNENAGRWSDMLSRARKRDTDLEAASVQVSGISLLWYWPGLQDRVVRFLNF